MYYRTLKFIKFKILLPIKKNINLVAYYKKQYNMMKQNYDMLRQLINVKDLKPITGNLRVLQLKNVEFAKEVFQILEKERIEPFMLYGTLLGAERHGGFIPWDDDIDFGLMRADYENLKKTALKQYKIFYQNINKFNPNNSANKTIKKLLKKYPNELFFLEYPYLIKAIKGADINNYTSIDFFPFDYYSDNYNYESFRKEAINNINYLWFINNTKKEIMYLTKKRLSNPYIVNNGKKIFYGIDNSDSQNYNTLFKYDNFMNVLDFFPLKKMRFEDTEFWAPNNHIKILEDYFGKNWCSIPDDILPPHAGERK